METLLVMGIIYWVVSKRRDKVKERPSRITQTRPQGVQSARSGSTSQKTPSYVDDGILTAEEAMAIIQLLSYYGSSDTLKQQEIQQKMDARIQAQFNHLLNSSWSMDGTKVLEYLAQQGRHGRYTALGAYALKVMR
ncbi:MAG: hypothetical protein FWE76_04535 [Symbiobacteriaceae bacterium]|nr:hypothetical protein [Symbiobacteriaceae bacterium]